MAREKEARGHTLATMAGITLIAMAVLDVLNGELTTGRVHVRVAVVVGSLVGLIFGVSLCLLARYARRRLPGAVLGIWSICALSLPYLLLELLAGLPGFAVQITFPGGNVVDTAKLQAILDDMRPAWHRPLDTTLSIACVVLLVWTVGALAAAAAPRTRVTAGALASAAAPRTRASAETAAETPAAPAEAEPEGATPIDPWNPTRVETPETTRPSAG
jgi:hypothetical protein